MLTLVRSRAPLLPKFWPLTGAVGANKEAYALYSTTAGDVYDVVIVGAGMVGAGLAAGLGGWIS